MSKARDISIGGPYAGSTNKYNPISYGADPTGFSDSAPAFQAAFNAAQGNGIVTVSPGTYAIQSTVLAKAPLWGLSGVANGLNTPTGKLPYLKSTIGSGAAVLDWDTFTVDMRNIAIGDFSVGDRSQGLPPLARNCKAVVAGNIWTGADDAWGGTYFVDNASCRGVMQNVHIRGCLVGLEWMGWLNYIQNVHITQCTTGFICQAQNTSDISMVLEGNDKDLFVKYCYDTNFSNLEMEGNTGTQSSTIDYCQNIVIGTIGCEGYHSYAPWLKVGTTAQVAGFTIHNGSIGHTESSNSGSGPTYLIELDNVIYPVIKCKLNDGDHRRGVKYTSNTVWADKKLFSKPWSGWPSVNITEHSHGVAKNFFPNRYCQGKRFGVFSTAYVRCTHTEETTITRSSGKAMKLQATAGTDSYMEISIEHAHIIAACVGKLITLGIWVWVPNITEYHEGGWDGSTSKGTSFVSFSLRAYNSGFASTDFATNGLFVTRNAWNFISMSGTCPSTVSGTATKYLTVKINVNASARANTTNEYIVVDEIVVAPGNVQNLIYEGKVIDHDLIPAKIEGTNLVGRVKQSEWTAILADTDQVWEVGDRFQWLDPTAGGTSGVVCTTGGVNPTAVWKTFSSIQA